MVKRLCIIAGSVIVLLLCLAIIEYVYILHNGSNVPAPAIPRQAQVFGSGPKLTYMVMGDSTSIGQGTDYANSYAMASAKHLAQNHTVTFINVGISGARAKDVVEQELAKAASHKPDVVLLAVGANDATHFSGGSSVRESFQTIIGGLQAANCNVRIVVTGSPAMDSVGRFPFPVRQIMGLRTKQVNKAIKPLIAKNKLTLAPIALKTRDAFLADPTLLAADKFHPDKRGYALWIPVVNHALDQALQAKTDQDCPKG